MEFITDCIQDVGRRGHQKSYSRQFITRKFFLLLQAPTPQNGQTLKQFVGRSRQKLFECVWTFCGVAA